MWAAGTVPPSRLPAPVGGGGFTTVENELAISAPQSNLCSSSSTNDMRTQRRPRGSRSGPGCFRRRPGFLRMREIVIRSSEQVLNIERFFRKLYEKSFLKNLFEEHFKKKTIRRSRTENSNFSFSLEKYVNLSWKIMWTSCLEKFVKTIILWKKNVKSLKVR